MEIKNSIMVLGPTASGKTRLAAHLASELNGAVLSFDSRQVYRKLNIGTGKDLHEFTINNQTIPLYLIDQADVGTNFHNYAFIKAYIKAWEHCNNQNQLPVICGGTGLYFDLALKQYQYINIPVDPRLRQHLETLTGDELLNQLHSYPAHLTSQADTSTLKRRIRAIEIAQWLSANSHQPIPYPGLKPLIIGIHVPVAERNMRIANRLDQRLRDGMVEEVRSLLQDGVPPEQLIHLGLEYKFITEHLLNKFDHETMVKLLYTAICQYAKRQMTWFRKMDREGFHIHWIDGCLTPNHMLQQALQLWNTSSNS